MWRWLLGRPQYVVVPALVLALYWRCLGLPFFWDDAANFNWMFRRPLASIWIDATGFPYYRPLVFTLWRALQVLFGPTTQLPFQLANVAAHTASALLAGALAGRVASRSGQPAPYLVPLTAGALFALFPFAPLAVCHTAQGFHMVVTALALGAVVSVTRYAETEGAAWALLPPRWPPWPPLLMSLGLW